MRAGAALLALGLALGCGPASKPPASPVRDPLDAPGPAHPTLRTGKLSNGLSYYVLEHDRGAERAALWLAVNAGSVLEDDDQRGVAHFVEHMAFNGTRRFRRIDLDQFIARAGLSVGADINATTGLDQTVYKLNVPTHQPALMLQALDILRDMAGDVSFEQQEVESERGIILEEWRMSRGAPARAAESAFPLLFEGSPYAERAPPIGLPDVIRKTTPATLKRFYQDWYRPDLMAVIAVGDFEAEDLEFHIRQRFTNLGGPAVARPRPTISPPTTLPRVIRIRNDVEFPQSSITVYDKVPGRRQETKRDYRNIFVEQLYLSIVDARLERLRSTPGTPFLNTRVWRKRFARTLDAITFYLGAKEGRLEEALERWHLEEGRLKRFGILPSEFERAKKIALVDMERVLLEADKSSPRSRAEEIVRHFMEGESMPGATVELAWVRELLPSILLQEVEALAHAHDGNRGRVIDIRTAKGTPTPSSARVQAILESKSALGRWKDDGPSAPLLTTDPRPGKVVAVAHEPTTDVTTWTLENGIKVVLKPTAFENDNVRLGGWQPGGTSLVSDEDFVHARFAGQITWISGAGLHSQWALSHALAGKRVSLKVELEELGTAVKGSARPADLETLLQYLHLRLTEPRVHQNAFDTWKQASLETLKHRTDAPDQFFAQEIARLRGNGHPRRRPVDAEMISAVDMQRALAVYQERFRDLGGFTFVFVGTLDLPTLQPLVERYLGSLPTRTPHEQWKDPGVTYPAGLIERRFRAGSEQRSRVWLEFGGPLPFTRDAAADARIFQRVVEARLTGRLREQLGGVYSIGVRAGVRREPAGQRTLTVSFACAPANVDKLRGAVFDELSSLAREGPDETEVTRVTTQLTRQHERNRAQNSWWLDRLLYAGRHGDNTSSVVDIDAVLSRVSRDQIKQTAQRMFDPKNYLLAILDPEKPSTTVAPPPSDADEDDDDEGDSDAVNTP